MTCLKDYLHYRDEQVTLLLGDALAVAAEMADDSVDCIVTSPPYFRLRDYGTEGQYGLESSPAEYVETMRALFSELRRVLADDGTLWLNIGDSYSGSGKGPVGVSAMVPNHAAAVGGKPYLGIPGKNLIGIPWRVAFALQDDGWILRNAIIWQKPNAMPESVTDRLSNRYEPVFMFSKSRRYWFDLDPIREPLQASSLARYAAGPVKIARLTPEEDRPANAYVPRSHSFNRGTKEADVPGQAYRQHRDREDPDPDHLGGRNPGDVWSIPTAPFPGAHFAVFPVALPQRCILAGCKPGGTVLDPFNGSGTTGLAAQRLGRKYVGIDVNAEYLDLSLRTRLHDAALDFNEVAP